MPSQRPAIGATRRTGTVVDVSQITANPPTVGVNIGGDTSTVTQCAYASSYVPLLNDQVALVGIDSGGDYVVVGALGSASIQGTSWATALVQHQNFNIAANTTTGFAPPSSTWHTRSNIGGTNNGTIVANQDCLLVAYFNTIGASTGDNMRAIFSISPGGNNGAQGDQQFSVAKQNWGGGWTVDMNFMVPMLAGDWVDVAYHTVGSPSNTWHNAFLSFILGTYQS